MDSATLQKAKVLEMNIRWLESFQEDLPHALSINVKTSEHQISGFQFNLLGDFYDKVMRNSMADIVASRLEELKGELKAL